MSTSGAISPAPATLRDLAAAVQSELDAGDEAMALRQVRAAMERVRAAAAHPGGLEAVVDDPARLTPDRWDALWCGAVAYTCHDLGADAPDWTLRPALPTFWFVIPDPALRAWLLQRTPSELAVLGVWLDAGSLHGL